MLGFFLLFFEALVIYVGTNKETNMTRTCRGIFIHAFHVL